MTKRIKSMISISVLSLTLGLTSISGVLPNTVQPVSAASRSIRHTGSPYYFPRCNSSCKSIVDALRSIGCRSDYSYRKIIAARNGISNYTGKASQNIALLNTLKSGRLIAGFITCR